MMTNEKIIAILADYKGCDASEINANTSFSELGLDSLDIVDLVMSIEEAFGVSIEMSEGIKTVADVAAIIDAK